jgi:hypothetical protein
VTTWELEVLDLAGNVLLDTGLEEAPFNSLTCSWVLNSPGGFEADLRWYAAEPADWRPGERELVVRRDGVRIWGGYLWSVEASARQRRATALGAGYFSRLGAYRVISTLLFDPPVAQHQIARDLIAHAMAQPDGDLGFTSGAHTGPTVTRRRLYCANERPNIAEAIEALASLENGFDFEIDANKAFNTWTPRRGGASGITFTGAEELTLEWNEDAREAASYVTAIGEGDCGPPLAEASDASARARFRRLHRVVEGAEGVDTLSEAQELANEELRQRKESLFRATVSFDHAFGPAWGSFGLGDTVTVDVADGMATFTRTLRIVEISLTLEPPEEATVELTLDAAL